MSRVLLVCLPVAAGQAFTLEIANQEVAEFGQGPRSIFVPGYGEVVFESGLDGSLVVESAYASTEQIEVPQPVPGASGTEASAEDGATAADQGFVKITNRMLAKPEPGAPVTSPLAADGWNAVPEAASATLGLIGAMLFFLRRRTRVSSGNH